MNAKQTNKDKIYVYGSSFSCVSEFLVPLLFIAPYWNVICIYICIYAFSVYSRRYSGDQTRFVMSNTLI